MRRKSFFVTAFFMIVIIATSSTFSAHPQVVTAESLKQEAADFTGKRIYFSEGTDDASRFDRSPSGVSRYASILETLGASVNSLEWRKGIPHDADLVVIVGPSTTLLSDQIARLWTYLQTGGHVLLFAEPPATGGTFSSTAGFFGLTWTDFGLRGRDDVVLTDTSTTSSKRPESGNVIVNFLTSSVNKSHPITADFSGTLAFFTARSLEINLSFEQLKITPLVFSDPNFYGEANYDFYLQKGELEYNIGHDTGRDALPLVAAFEDDASGGRMVVIGDKEFVTNGGGFQTSPDYSNGLVYPDNARFLLRTSAWLVNVKPSELTFPTPAPTGTATITPTPTQTPTLLPTGTATPIVTSTPAA